MCVCLCVDHGLDGQIIRRSVALCRKCFSTAAVQTSRRRLSRKLPVIWEARKELWDICPDVAWFCLSVRCYSSPLYGDGSLNICVCACACACANACVCVLARWGREGGASVLPVLSPRVSHLSTPFPPLNSPLFVCVYKLCVCVRVRAYPNAPR